MRVGSNQVEEATRDRARQSRNTTSNARPQNIPSTHTHQSAAPPVPPPAAHTTQPLAQFRRRPPARPTSKTSPEQHIQSQAAPTNNVPPVMFFEIESRPHGQPNPAVNHRPDALAYRPGTDRARLPWHPGSPIDLGSPGISFVKCQSPGTIPRIRCSGHLCRLCLFGTCKSSTILR